MSLNWFYELNVGLIVLALMGGMMLAAEVGYQAGRFMSAHGGDKGLRHFGTVLSPMLALVALLLGFSFNMAVLRYDTRRQLVTDDANALTALYLQSSLLPEPQRKQFKQQLRRYVDQMADIALRQRELTEEEMTASLIRVEESYREMWELVRAMAQDNPPVKGAETLLPLLGNAHAVGFLRVFAFLSRVPAVIIALLLGASLIAICAVGFVGGLGQHRGLMAQIMLTLLIGGTVFIILHLDRPERGLIRVDQSPMLLTREVMERDPETAP